MALDAAMIKQEPLSVYYLLVIRDRGLHIISARLTYDGGHSSRR
jgi:hypothetical protein